MFYVIDTDKENWHKMKVRKDTEQEKKMHQLCVVFTKCDFIKEYSILLNSTEGGNKGDFYFSCCCISNISF